MATVSPPVLIDIGANLTHSSFTDDLPEVLDRARVADIATIIVIGTDLQSSTEAVALAKRTPELYATVGWHPHHAEHFSDNEFAQLEALSCVPEVKAIGETGLDFYRNYAAHTDQEKVFARLLELAINTGLPLFVHERDAHKRVCE